MGRHTTFPGRLADLSAAVRPGPAGPRVVDALATGQPGARQFWRAFTHLAGTPENPIEVVGFAAQRHLARGFKASLGLPPGGFAALLAAGRFAALEPARLRQLPHQ